MVNLARRDCSVAYRAYTCCVVSMALWSVGLLLHVQLEWPPSKHCMP